jgi:hypothetical protein
MMPLDVGDALAGKANPNALKVMRSAAEIEVLLWVNFLSMNLVRSVGLKN